MSGHIIRPTQTDLQALGLRGPVSRTEQAMFSGAMVEHCSFDAFGFYTERRRTSGAITTIETFIYGRFERTAYLSQSTSTPEGFEQELITVLSWDDNGHILSNVVSSPKDGRVTGSIRYQYDTLGVLIRTESEDEPVYIDDESDELLALVRSTAEYRYEGTLHPVQITRRDSEGAVASEVSLEYDDAGRVVRSHYRTPSGGEILTTNVYNLIGDVVESDTTINGTHRRKTTTDYEYDARQNWVKRTEVTDTLTPTVQSSETRIDSRRAWYGEG